MVYSVVPLLRGAVGRAVWGVRAWWLWPPSLKEITPRKGESFSPGSPYEWRWARQGKVVGMPLPCTRAVHVIGRSESESTGLPLFPPKRQEDPWYNISAL